MARLFSSLGCSLLLLHAQAQVPPDPTGDTVNTAIGYRVNAGQVIDTEGDARPDVHFYSEGSFPQTYLREASQVSFCAASIDTTSSTPDTLFRVDMTIAGEHSAAVDPMSHALKSGLANYYLLQTAPDGAEGVERYDRIIYEAIYPDIDLHFYCGSGGQKMAFVCWPGSDPEADILLEFQGQDSLGVDVYGTLDAYFGDKWIRLPEAVAYQYDSENEIIPVNWGAEYEHVHGTDEVSFHLGSYNPNAPLVDLDFGATGSVRLGPTRPKEPGLEHLHGW